MIAYLIDNGFNQRPGVRGVVQSSSKRIYQRAAQSVELARVKCYLTHDSYQVANVFLWIVRTFGYFLGDLNKEIERFFFRTMLKPQMNTKGGSNFT